MSEFKEITTKNLQKSIKRLTALADYMRDNVKNKHFELASFFDTKGADEGTVEELKEARKQLQEGFCGTTACAIGHACLMPEFQKKGLRVRILDSYWGSDKKLACSYKNKQGEVFEDFEAAREFFKISDERAEKLFSPEGYSTVHWKDSVSKSQVVKAIRDYVYRANKHLQKRIEKQDELTNLVDSI